MNEKSNIIVFIKIPKTASTFFEVHFENKIIEIEPGVFKKIESVGHSWVYPTWIRGWQKWETENIIDFNYYEVNTFNINDYYSSIITIRNPFDIFFSYFNYNWSNCKEQHNINMDLDYSVEDFQKFVDIYLDDSIPFHAPAFKKSLFSQLKDKDGNWIINEKTIILRYENIQEDLEYFSKRVNVPLRDYSDFSLRKTDFRKPCKWYEAYRDDQIDRLTILWKEDLDYFNYSYK